MRRITAAGNSYQERQKGRVQCTEYREEMALGLLAGHIQTHHGKETDERWRWEATSPSGEPHTYNMDVLTTKGPRNCPVEGCPGQA